MKHFLCLVLCFGMVGVAWADIAPPNKPAKEELKEAPADPPPAKPTPAEEPAAKPAAKPEAKPEAKTESASGCALLTPAAASKNASLILGGVLLLALARRRASS